MRCAEVSWICEHVPANSRGLVFVWLEFSFVVVFFSFFGLVHGKLAICNNDAFFFFFPHHFTDHVARWLGNVAMWTEKIAAVTGTMADFCWKEASEECRKRERERFSFVMVSPVYLFLGPPPRCPFYPFLAEGSPTKIDYRQKSGTCVLSSLLEDLAFLGGNTPYS